MQICKKNEGITLVALIITIIILLILAGVSLSFVFNGGILDKSQQAVNEYKNESEKEKNLLEQIDKYLENELSGNSGVGPVEPEIPTVDENGLADKDTTITTDDPNIQIVIPKGFAPVILQTDRTDSMPGENGAVKEIMPIEEWNNITAEQINKGIVVVDNAITYDGGQATGAVSDFNEYVWIPMPDSSKFARVAWTTPWGFNENGEWIDTGVKHPIVSQETENAYWEDTSTVEYMSMINSISINKGFYISRYEASESITGSVQSKRGQDIWVKIHQKDAITVSNNMKPNINSHLIYGIEWDSVLNWFIGNAYIRTDNNENKIMELTDIQSNSNGWGNFKNSDNSASLEKSGTSEYWKANNIYDLAGNVYEWTQERYSIEGHVVDRGGIYYNMGNERTAAYRGNINNTSTQGDTGFRVCFYI